MNAVIRNGSLWTCHHVGVQGTNGVYATNDATGTNVDRSGIQWLRLDVSTNGGGLNYGGHGRVFDHAATNPKWYYFPSLAVNAAGDTLIGFSGSSATNYVGAYYTWRTSCGPTFPSPRLIHDGEIALGQDRWGDYSQTCVDPSDHLTFWTVQEYSRKLLDVYFWGTWLARISPH